MFKLGGVIPALVTPFTDDGKNIDEERSRRLIRHVMSLGVTGLVPCGTTGEFQNLSEQERRRVVEIAIDEAKGRIPVIAGTGASGTDLAIEKTTHAKDAGADAAIIVTPYFTNPQTGASTNTIEGSRKPSISRSSYTTSLKRQEYHCPGRLSRTLSISQTSSD